MLKPVGSPKVHLTCSVAHPFFLLLLLSSTEYVDTTTTTHPPQTKCPDKIIDGMWYNQVNN